MSSPDKGKSLPRVQKLQLSTNGTPIDSVSLAHWLGIKHGTLWWLVLKRAEMYKEFKLPKGNSGKFRTINEPLAPLKHVQEMVTAKFLDRFTLGDQVGAYVKGRGIQYTAERHAGHSVVLELDIKDFFGSTTRSYVRRFFYDNKWSKPVAKMMADLLTMPTSPEKSIVPQGSPSSPAICNLVGQNKIDQPIMAFLRAINGDWAYTRYSDNLIISSPTEKSHEEVNMVLSEIKKLVSVNGYRVNQHKIKIMRNNNPKRAQKLLGLTVNEKPNIDQAKYYLLRAQVHRAKLHGFGAVTGLPDGVSKTPEAIQAHLQGVISYYCFIANTDRMKKLKAQLDEAIKLHSSKSVSYTVVNV